MKGTGDMQKRLLEALEDVGSNPTPLFAWHQGAMFPNEGWMRLDAEGNVQFGADKLPALHYDLIWRIAGEITRECLLSETGDDVGCDNHYIAPDTLEPCADVADLLDAIESAPERILSLIGGSVTYTVREEEE